MINQARSRDMLRTARIDYSTREITSADGVPVTSFSTWRAAGEDLLEIYWGDQDRVVLRGDDGKPAEFTYNGPLARLAKDRKVWVHQESNWNADVWNDSRRDFFGLSDLRTLGLFPVSHWAQIDQLLERHGQPPLEYETEPEGELVRITASIAGSPGSAFRWWLDPARDHAVVRMGVWQDGQQIGDVRCTLERFDGHWFPKRIETRRLGAGDRLDGEASKVIEILHAEFNRPDHPAELTPRDIGLEPGTQLTFHDEPDRIGSHTWDGEKPVPTAEFFERVLAGELHWGPALKREIARMRAQRERAAILEQNTQAGGADADGVPGRWRRMESLWEAYTREFIERHQLEPEQVQRAWLVLKHCQDLAGQYLLRARSGLEACERELAAAPAERRGALTERLQALLKPLDAIFEQQLKPRLERLLTRAQREAARTDTRPGSRQD